MKNQQRLIVGLVLSLLLVVFALLNGQPVQVNVFGARFSWPLIIVIIGAVLLGALITLLVSSSSINQQKKALAEANAKQAELSDQVAELQLKLEAPKAQPEAVTKADEEVKA